MNARYFNGGPDDTGHRRGRRIEPEPAQTYLFCDECGRDAFQPISLAGVGIACSRTCMDALATKHERRMHRHLAASATTR